MSAEKTTLTSKIAYLLWDVWCVGTVVGIWPRFIEPNLLTTTTLKLPIRNLPIEFEGLKIIQLSDLHLKEKHSKRFLEKIKRKIQKLQPDLLFLTGDFICYSTLEDPYSLKQFLNQFSAPLGCFAVLGNHDYAKASTINESGDYDVIQEAAPSLFSGFKRLAKKPKVTTRFTHTVKEIGFHQELIDLIHETPFQLLHNETATIEYKGKKLNVCGVGEYVLGKLHPQKAFEDYIQEAPGIILAHNPDAVPFLSSYPGDIILCGHTHGYQVNLPWFRDRFCIVENKDLVRGLKLINKKWVYINRGVGSTLPFRWFSLPEITLITLTRKG